MQYINIIYRYECCTRNIRIFRMYKNKNQLFIKTTTLFILINVFSASASGLELDDAEQIALNNAPEIKQLDARRHQLEEEAIADGQLSDPNLISSLSNMPVDTFNFSQEPMTQIQLGLQQSFPKGKSLRYARNKKNHLAAAEKHNSSLAKIEILKDVRIAWLELLFWIKVLEITKEQKIVFTTLLETTQSLLANNIAQQHDVIRAQLELIELDNRLIEVDKNIRVSKSKLARWLGREYINQAYPRHYPKFPELDSYQVMEEALWSHPVILAHQETISSNRNNVKWSCEQYKPGVTAGLSYGYRQGRNTNQSKRANFLSATAKMDLPIFGKNRQARRISASQDLLIASQEKEEVDFRNLVDLLDSEYAKFQEQSKQNLLYREKLIPQAKQYAEATLLAYRNGKSDFPALARSYIIELETKIAGVKIRIDRDKAHVNLLYLKGGDHV